jgi:regulator of cell morphogenesis and NO signaling
MDATQTLAELVMSHPETVAVFERRGLDFCCQGRRSLATACAEQGLDVTAVLAELAAAVPAAAAATDWTTASLTSLTEHIVAVHHAYVRQALPTIGAHTRKVAEVHGAGHPELAEVARLFAAVTEEMDGHMFKEEQILFPFIVGLERHLAGEGELPHACFGTVAGPIHVMESEHESAGGALARIRELTHDYTPPADACTTYRLTLKELQQFEADLHVHVHKENYILHPRALAMEARLAEAPTACRG